MTSFDQQPPAVPLPTRRIVDDIEAHHAGVAVWWTSLDGWLIKANDVLIGTDLAIEDDNRISQAPILTAELAPVLDIAFITHAHGDHWNHATARILTEQGACSRLPSCPPAAPRTHSASASRRAASGSPGRASRSSSGA